MSEEREEGPIMTTEVNMQPEEREEGPTSIDVAGRQISIGEAPAIVPQEEKLQKQIKEIEQVQEVSGRTQKRRQITSHLTNILKQVEKNGNQINKMISIQSLQRQKQKQTKPITGAGESKSQLQSIKQIQSQVSQLQKQVTRIQNDIQKIRTAPVPKTRPIKLSSTKPRSKRSKSPKSIKVKRHRRSR